ncbi:MAG: MIP family channel protein, partial [Nocardioides sp.]
MTDSPTLVQKLSAEVLGTFMLVFFGVGAAIIVPAALGSQLSPEEVRFYSTIFQVDVLGVAMAFGLAVMVAIYSFGRVSGAHFNPAVSFGAAVSGRMQWREVGPYAGAQLVGAVLGAAVLWCLVHGFDDFDATGNMGQNSFGDDGSGYAWWAAFLLEVVMTALFVWVILAVTDDRNDHPALAPLAIGFGLVLAHLVGIAATGTSVNPARSIGPALFAGTDAIQQLWLFILAPLLGAAIAGLAYPILFGRVGEAVPGSGISFSRPRTAAQVPGYASPDQYQQQWNQETAPAPAPIVQDGWQWDPAGQQWHPVGSTPEQWQAQQAAEAQQAAQQAAEPAADYVVEETI